MTDRERKEVNDLIIRIARGDEAALASLYHKIGSRLLSVAMGVTHDRHLAEDAVQEALLRIVKYAGSFKRTENGYGWACKIARNAALTVLQRYGRNDANIDDFYHLSDPRYGVEHSTMRQDLKNALLKLAPDDRRLIWLRYICDYTLKDIAIETGMPKSTVAYRIEAAEKLLKKYLE